MGVKFGAKFHPNRCNVSTLCGAKNLQIAPNNLNTPAYAHACMPVIIKTTRNSLGDEIANANFFYDDIVHVEASAYAHGTDFLISNTHLRYLPTHPSNRVLMWTRPSNPLWCTMDLPIATRNSPGDMGVSIYSLKWRPLPPLVLPK